MPHHRLLHEEGFVLEKHDDGRMVFVNREGRTTSGARDVLTILPESIALLQAQHAELGLNINPNTGFPKWDGMPMEYDWEVARLMKAAG